MPWIRYDPSKGVAIHGARLFEVDTVLVEISCGFLGIPLKTQNQKLPPQDYGIAHSVRGR